MQSQGALARVEAALHSALGSSAGVRTAIFGTLVIRALQSGARVSTQIGRTAELSTMYGSEPNHTINTDCQKEKKWHAPNDNLNSNATLCLHNTMRTRKPASCLKYVQEEDLL